MDDTQIVDPSFTAMINAPLEKIDIPAWCFALGEKLLRGMAAATTRNRYQRLANTNVQVCQLATWATIVRAIATHQN